MAYNIQMNYYDGSSYQELNPRTLLANVSDWRNSIYNKTEVDSIKSTLQGNIDNVENSLQNNIDNIHKIRYHTSFNVNLADRTSTTEGNIAFTDYIYNYNKIIIDLSNIELGDYGFFRFFKVATIQLSDTDRLIIYETMNYNSTNYIYVSYGSSANVPVFNDFRTLSSSENMEYYLKGKMSGTINVYAS